MLFLIVPTPSQEENRKHKRFWSDNKKGNGARSEAGQKRFPMARVLTKLAAYAGQNRHHWKKCPTPSCSLRKFPLAIRWENRSSAEVRAKKAAPDAQGRLQCRKWREF